MCRSEEQKNRCEGFLFISAPFLFFIIFLSIGIGFRFSLDTDLHFPGMILAIFSCCPGLLFLFALSRFGSTLGIRPGCCNKNI